MNITVDTNVLVRAVVHDDQAQAVVAVKTLREADTIAVTLPCLCEFVWVLARLYAFARADICATVRALLAAANVLTDRPAVDAGLVVLEAGGDFADGVIAYQGQWLGGASFVSFDRKAVSVLVRQGANARLLT